jgi:flagellar protein FlaG
MMLNPPLDTYSQGNSLASVQRMVGGVAANSDVATTPKLLGQGSSEDGGSSAFPPATKQDLSNAVDKLNKFVAPTLQSIEFSIDEESNSIVVKVVDTATKKVLRQIPNEEVMAISKTLGKLQGLVIRQTA